MAHKTTTLSDIAKPCFSAIAQLRSATEAPGADPALLHTRMRTYLDTFYEEARAAGFREHDIEDAAYAIVALTDEVMLQGPPPLRDYWLPRLLQLHYFRENLAGENFYLRLAEIRRDSHRKQVLRVYYQCLLFGFLGKYRIRGGELELASITESIQAQIESTEGLNKAALAPQGERPKESKSALQAPTWTRWVAAGALAAALVLYVVLRFSIATKAADVRASIDAMTEADPNNNLENRNMDNKGEGL